MDRAGGVGLVGGALALEVGHECHAAGTGRCSKREVGQLLVRDAEHPGCGVEDPRGIEGRDQRQEPAGRVGEPGDGARRVTHGRVGDGARHARRTDRDDHVTHHGAEAEGGGGVVAGAGAEQCARRHREPGLGGAEDPRHDRVVAQAELEEVTAVLTGRGRPVAGAARITAVGDQRVEGGRAGELPGQPVVREADGGRARGVVGLVVAEPAQLGDRERRDRHQPDRVDPGLRSAELVDQVERGLGGAGVVPEQSRAYDGSVGVEADHAVLLAADGDRVDVVEPARGLDGLLERVPPRIRMHLGALRVGSVTAAHERTGLRIADDDLAGLGRGVDPGNEWHVPDPITSPIDGLSGCAPCAMHPENRSPSSTAASRPRSSRWARACAPSPPTATTWSPAGRQARCARARAARC